MPNENGTWVMYGVSRDDPECLHTVDEAIEYIKEIGFLPLFKNDIPGFSLEERTVPEYWWSEDPKVDPWMWREIIARRGDIAYGKFFDKKAGFISREWLPYFVNYRRDGYDFDALWEEGKASAKQKKIMDLYSEESEEEEYYSNELKKKAGFGKEGERALKEPSRDYRCRCICVCGISGNARIRKVSPMDGRLLYTQRRSTCGDMMT